MNNLRRSLLNNLNHSRTDKQHSYNNVKILKVINNMKLVKNKDKISFNLQRIYMPNLLIKRLLNNHNKKLKKRRKKKRRKK